MISYWGHYNALKGRSMRYNKFGRTDIKVSNICLGTMTWGQQNSQSQAWEQLDYAVEQGINFIDTAEMYPVPRDEETSGRTEEYIGQWLAERGGRDKVILATKIVGRSPHGWFRNNASSTRLNREQITEAVDKSLGRLKTDYIDLYQIHRQAPDIPIEETLSALTDLVRQGKIRYIGCSTHPAWAVMEAILRAELKGYVRFSVEQPPYNLLDRRIENELLPMAEKYGLGIITWSPLAMGVLVGVYAEEEEYPPDSRAALRGGFYADRVTKKGIQVGNKFVKLAQDAGMSAAQLGILWCKDQPGITAPLIGPEKMEHLVDLLPVLDMTLSDELREACDNLVPPGSAVANFHNTSDWLKGQIL